MVYDKVMCWNPINILYFYTSKIKANIKNAERKRQKKIFRFFYTLTHILKMDISISTVSTVIRSSCMELEVIVVNNFILNYKLNNLQPTESMITGASGNDVFTMKAYQERWLDLQLFFHLSICS